jgi:hypothetical protein
MSAKSQRRMVQLDEATYHRLTAYQGRLALAVAAGQVDGITVNEWKDRGPYLPLTACVARLLDQEDGHRERRARSAKTRAAKKKAAKKGQ